LLFIAAADAFTRWIKVDNNGVSRCTFKVNGDVCGDAVSTNGAKRHFQRKHNGQYNAPLRSDAGVNQPKLPFPVIKGPKDTERDRLVALFFGTTSTALKNVENEYFKRLVKGAKGRNAVRRDVIAAWCKAR
jgi:hypothetical protein